MNQESLLEQPRDEDYLWRYFKCFDHLKYFLDGKIRLNRLSSFDDFQEAMHPELYYLLQIANNLTIVDYRLKSEKMVGTSGIGMLDFGIKNIVENFNLSYLQNHLMKIWEIKNSDEFRNRLNIEMESIKEKVFQHNLTQSKIYSSCWVINNSWEEDYLMWKNYCAPGGFAVRICFKDFKYLLDKSFDLEENKEFLNPSFTKSFYTGKVIYNHYLGSDWIGDVKKGLPLSFLKHSSYKHEKEFRICVEYLSANNQFKDFNFYDIYLFQNCDIIMHPSSSFNQYSDCANMFKSHGINQKINFSSIMVRSE